jgi:hypothetical protein
MITILPETTGYTLAIKASGKLSAENYETVFLPILDKLIKRYGQIRLVMQFDENFEGWEAGAMWDDAKFGLQHRNDFKRIAVVGAPKWVEWATKVGAKLMDGELKTYPSTDLFEAIVWVKQ